MEKKYKVIALCGSTKFKKEYQEVQEKLTLDGKVVITLGFFGHSELWGNKDKKTIPENKKKLDDMHKHIIDMADEIYVIDVGGYVEESMKSDINYAKSKNKTIRYYSKEISSDVHEYAFQKLTPTVKANLTTYEDALEYVFCDKNKDVQNIAVTGIYGSGKSSVINTYEREYKKKFVHISLCHFDGVANEESENILEKKIVNQLVQQVPEKLIPETRFQIKKEFCIWKAILQTLKVFVLGVLVLYFFQYGDLIQNDNLGKYQWAGIITSPCTLVGTMFLFSVLLISLLVELIKWQKQNHVIRKVAVKGNEMEFADNQEDKSYFNRHIDEILYVLEKITTAKVKDRFDGIVFEDLDRFDKEVDTKVFEKLREICVLGNKRIEKNKGAGHPTLRFFYLLSDETFLSKERTKFFDYILPIIPVVDTSNAYAKIKNGLVQAGYENAIDDRFLRGLSLYFDDYRLIKNILNEFQIYAKKLTNIEHNYNELLALIVYKNYFPKDYAELQLHSGYVYSLFERRDSMIKEKTDSLNDLLIIAKDRLTALKNEMLASEKELQAVKDNRKEKSAIYKDMTYSEWERTEYPKRLQAIRDKDSRKEKEIREEIVKLQTEIIHVNNKKLKELLISDNDASEFILSNNEDEDSKGKPDDKTLDIIRYLIMSGYLDDASYRDYMACFDENGMSIVDKNYLIAVNNRTGKLYDYKLDNPELVYENLVDDDFLVAAIKNIDLIDYLIRQKRDISFERFVMQLKESKDVDFIAQYLRKTACYSVFIAKVCQLWDDFLNVVISDNNQTMSLAERQQVVLTSLIVCSNEEIKNQNNSGMLKEYLEKGLSEATCDDDDAAKVAEKLDVLSAEIQDLDAHLGGENLRKEIIKNSLYAINLENLKSILKKELARPEDDINNKFLSSLTNSDDTEISSNMLNELAGVISVVVENFDSQSDNPEMVQRVSNSEIDTQLIKDYLSISETIIEDISKVNFQYWSILVQKHTMYESTENILLYFEKYGLDDFLVTYLNKANIKMNLDFNTEPDRSGRLWSFVYKTNGLSDGAYYELVEQMGHQINNFNTFGIEESKCLILIDHNLIPMTANTINLFRTHYKALMHDFICSDTTNYVILTQGAMFSIDEVKSLLEEESVKEEDKIKLLNRTTEAISVIDKTLSDVVFKNILERHFDVNDLQYLAINYEKYNDECKATIYDMMVAHKSSLLDVANEASTLLIEKLFSDQKLSLTEKANILEVLILNKKSDNYIAILLVAAGEEMLSRLFGQKRSRMSLIDNSSGHKRLLTILKENKIIRGYTEDGNYIRIIR